MKKIIFVILAFVNFSFGVSLMNYEFFDRQNRIDIVLSFDSAYKPDITRREGENLVIILKGVSCNEKHLTQLNSRIVSEFDIVPHQNATHIVFQKGAKLNVEAVMQNENLSLVLRVSDPNLNPIAVGETQTNEKKKSSFGPTIMILCVLILLVLVYFLMKKFGRKKSKKSVDDTWDHLNKFDNAKDYEPKNEVFTLRSDNEFESLDDIRLANPNYEDDEIKIQDDFVVQKDDFEIKDDEFEPYEAPKSEFVADKIDKTDERSNRISEILENEKNDDIVVTDDIKVISKIKMDNGIIAVVLKHGEKNHLVVLRDENRI